MPSLTYTASNKSTRWSKILLVGSTLLLAYSLVVVIATHHHHHFHGEHHGHHGHHSWSHSHSHEMSVESHGHHGHHHGHDEHGPHPHPHNPVHHLALLALVTSITGIIASFSHRRGCVVAFVVLLLLLELSALGAIAHGASKGYEMCHERSKKLVVERKLLVSENRNVAIVAAVDQVRAVEDVPAEINCMEHVRHAVILGGLIVGIICTSLACCGSKFGRAVFDDEVNEHRRQMQFTTIVIGEAASETAEEEKKANNADDDEEETVQVNSTLITRA